jgi:hypothetical protein
MTNIQQPLFKSEIEYYLTHVLGFEAYSFKSASSWGKVGLENAINLLNPDEKDLNDAAARIKSNGFSRLVVYLGSLTE